MAEAETHPGFTFAIMIDQGAIKWDSCSGCSPQQALVSQLQYLEQTYFPSPAYMTQQGRPVVTNFNIDLSYTIDWAAASAALSTQPVFIFQNNSGFTHVLSDGSYSWVMPTTTDYGMSLSDKFLRHRPASDQRTNRRRNLQGIQRYSGVLGLRPHNGPAMRANVVADIF